MSEKLVSIIAAIKVDRPRKDGTFPIHLRMRIGRKMKNYPLKKYIKKEDWDANTRTAKKSHEHYKDLNLLISQKLTAAKQIIYRIENDNKPVTFNNFEIHFYGSFIADPDFYKYAADQLLLWKARLSKDTFSQYETELGKIKKFNSSFVLSDIDHVFLNRYQAYMISELKNKKNTIAKSMKVLRTFVLEAYRRDLILSNPFKNFSVKWEEGERTFLTMQEVDELEKYLFKCTSTKIKNVLKYFLFCCYTGLRYGGIKELEYKHIREGVISIHGAEVPIIDRAMALIGKEKKAGKIFNVISNKNTNDYLKLAFEACSIYREDQILSFHSSRHTFATISLNLGISSDVVQEMLGHQNQKTTRIYAKMQTTTIKQAMQVWDKPQNQ